MFEGDDLIGVVRGWVLKAEDDLQNAAHTLKLKRNCPTDTVCYHAQQCVEKYLKALLVWGGLPIPKTHDISDLIRRLPEAVRPILGREQQELLTDYATVTRYPGDYEAISVANARSAVRLARQVRSQTRKLLPRTALRSL